MNKMKPVFVALCLLAISACAREAPTGQVVARVNGEEVTVAELNQEAESRGVADANVPEVRRQLLQVIIDRKLMAQDARERKLDRSPEYLIKRKQADELLLADLLVGRVLASEEPSFPAVERYMADNPAAFAQRTLFTVDQITFPQAGSEQVVTQLAVAKSLSEVEAVLARAGLPRQRATAQWDSAKMPPDLTAKLKALPPGEAFVLTSNPSVAGVIIRAEASPLLGPERAKLAAEGASKQGLRQAATDWLARARATAKIDYQPSYAPPAPAKPGSGSGASTPAKQ